MKTLFPIVSTAEVILALAWWKWLFLVPGGLIGLAWLWVRAHRRMVRKHLIRYLREVSPELEIVLEKSHCLVFRSEKLGEGQMNLHNMFRQLDMAKAITPEAERLVFKSFLSGLLDNMELAARPMTLASDGDFLLPRLVNSAHLAELQAAGKVPSLALEETGVSVVYVRDSESAVSYVGEGALVELGLDIRSLHEHALGNLRKKSPADFVRPVVEGKSLLLLKSGDTFDAARLLLVPRQLLEGETVAAMIPDRDTLGLAPAPADGNWTALAKLSRAADGRPLLDKPLKVSRSGFELIK